jgi:hypothetical protein
MLSLAHKILVHGQSQTWPKQSLSCIAAAERSQIYFQDPRRNEVLDDR